jgi:hypothetical protein
VGASEALLITTSGFSQVVQEQAAVLAREERTPLVPVQLVDGPALLRALISHRVGVTDAADGALLVLDEAYFEALERACPGNARKRGAASPASSSGSGGAAAMMGTGVTGRTRSRLRVLRSRTAAATRTRHKKPDKKPA